MFSRFQVSLQIKYSQIKKKKKIFVFKILIKNIFQRFNKNSIQMEKLIFILFIFEIALKVIG